MKITLTKKDFLMSDLYRLYLDVATSYLDERSGSPGPEVYREIQRLEDELRALGVSDPYGEAAKGVEADSDANAEPSDDD